MHHLHTGAPVGKPYTSVIIMSVASMHARDMANKNTFPCDLQASTSISSSTYTPFNPVYCHPVTHAHMHGSPTMNLTLRMTQTAVAGVAACLHVSLEAMDHPRSFGASV